MTAITLASITPGLLDLAPPKGASGAPDGFAPVLASLLTPTTDAATTVAPGTIVPPPGEDLPAVTTQSALTVAASDTPPPPTAPATADAVLRTLQATRPPATPPAAVSPSAKPDRFTWTEAPRPSADPPLPLAAPSLATPEQTVPATSAQPPQVAAAPREPDAAAPTSERSAASSATASPATPKPLPSGATISCVTKAEALEAVTAAPQPVSRIASATRGRAEIAHDLPLPVAIKAPAAEPARASAPSAPPADAALPSPARESSPAAESVSPAPSLAPVPDPLATAVAVAPDGAAPDIGSGDRPATTTQPTTRPHPATGAAPTDAAPSRPPATQGSVPDPKAIDPDRPIVDDPAEPADPILPDAPLLDSAVAPVIVLNPPPPPLVDPTPQTADPRQVARASAQGRPGVIAPANDAARPSAKPINRAASQAVPASTVQPTAPTATPPTPPRAVAPAPSQAAPVIPPVSQSERPASALMIDGPQRPLPAKPSASTTSRLAPAPAPAPVGTAQRRDIAQPVAHPIAPAIMPTAAARTVEAPPPQAIAPTRAEPATPRRAEPTTVAPRPDQPAILPAFQMFGAALHRAAVAERRPSPVALATREVDGQPLATPVAPAPIATLQPIDQAVVDLTQPHWPEAMITRIERLRDEQNAGDTRIRLHPDALGAIDVTLRRDGDAVQVQLRSAEPGTARLLADAQPRLHELAEQRGLRLTGDVSSGGQQGWAGDRRQPAPAPVPAQPTRRSTGDTAADDPTDTRLA